MRSQPKRSKYFAISFRLLLELVWFYAAASYAIPSSPGILESSPSARNAGIFREWSRIMRQPIRAYPRNQRTNQFLRVLCGSCKIQFRFGGGSAAPGDPWQNGLESS
jgi:hypothetical protein